MFARRKPQACQQPQINIWRTLSLDTSTADDYWAQIKQSGMLLHQWGHYILRSPDFNASETETEVNLVSTSAYDLGFKKGAPFQEICARAKQLGLELCPQAVGPRLRLSYQDQPINEWLVVAMTPVALTATDVVMFSIGHDTSGLWLAGADGHPEYFWDSEYRFLFVKSRV